jgi:hypothetical protein
LGSGDGTEDVSSTRKARGGDDGPDVSIAVSRLQGAVAIGDLALNDGGAEVALAGIIVRFDLAGAILDRLIDLGCYAARNAKS